MEKEELMNIEIGSNGLKEGLDKIKVEVPIYEKSNLTLEEAAKYFNIGTTKLRNITNKKGCEFVLFVGKKRLIKRKLFDEYLSNRDSI